MLQRTVIHFSFHIFVCISYALQMGPGINTLLCWHNSRRKNSNWCIGSENRLLNGCNDSIWRSCPDRSVWNSRYLNWLLWNRVLLLWQRLLYSPQQCCSPRTLCKFLLGQNKTWMISQFINTRHGFDTVQYPVWADNVNRAGCFRHLLVFCLNNNSS